jgi:hypothetical protein
MSLYGIKRSSNECFVQGFSGAGARSSDQKTLPHSNLPDAVSVGKRKVHS